MAARRWQLPGIQDLTKDQEVALGHPVKGQCLIIGGPGTGKSVVVTLRARQLEALASRYVFLVYNHMLHEYCKQLSGGEINSSTYVKWYSKVFRQSTDEHSLPGKDPGRAYPIDWQAAAGIIERKYSAESPALVGSDDRTCLLIDEGQDMSPEFYGSLIRLGYEDFFVAADQNQQITESNSSRSDLEDCLAIETEDVIELTYNFRNNYGVARLAQAFYTGDPATPPPALPKPRGRLHLPLLYTFIPESNAYVRIGNAIVKYALRDASMLVGVFTANNELRSRYYKALTSARNRLHGSSIVVSTYRSGSKPNVRFDQGGIVVLNAQSCKGLEFDTVVLADIDEHLFTRDDPDVTKKLFYVMVSRARQRVFLMMKRNTSSPIRNLLPDDEGVLRRKDL